VKRCRWAYLLWFLGGFGILGLHRFYLGRWATGMLWLCTGGLLGVGAVADLVLLPSMVHVENLSRELLRESNRRCDDPERVGLAAG
jgi:hypothetical protein